MNNTFKTNSRFASLLEEKEENTQNVYKEKTNQIINTSNKQGIFESNSDYIRRNTLEQEKKRVEEQNIETEKINKMLSSKDAFPDLLISNKKQNTTNNTTNKIDYASLSEKIKNKQLEQIPEKEVKKNINPGWTIISQNNNNNLKQVINNDYNIRKKTDNEYAMSVLNALCDLHERETQNYIDKYGYDNWEKKYIDTDWDYEYYDRLDEEYEVKLLEEKRVDLIKKYENEYEDDDYEYDYY